MARTLNDGIEVTCFNKLFQTPAAMNRKCYLPRVDSRVDEQSCWWWCMWHMYVWYDR